MEENRNPVTHRVQMTNRTNGLFTGILDVLSFDVAEILLETSEGMLLVKGKDLHVNRLTLEKGEVDIEGRIDSLVYSDAAPQGKEGILSGQVISMIEISETIYKEADFFLLSLICGAALVSVYDLLRIFRELILHSVAALALEDLLYWLFGFGVIFYLLNEKNDGMVRLFFLLGVCTGMLFYNRFISPKLVDGIVRVIKKTIFFLLRPILFLGKKIHAGKKILQKRRKKYAIMWKKQLKKVSKVVKIGVGKR